MYIAMICSVAIYFDVWFNTVATRLCHILLENTPVDDIITVFSSHDLLMGDDLTVVTDAPSDHLKKIFLLKAFQDVSLSVWLTICDVVNKSKILKHISDEVVKGTITNKFTYALVDHANATSYDKGLV